MDVEKLQYILANMENAVFAMSGKKPGGRPLLLFPSGKVRIEFFGTFDNVSQAYERLKRVVDRISSGN